MRVRAHSAASRDSVKVTGDDIRRTNERLAQIVARHQRYDGPHTSHDVDDCTCGEVGPYPCETGRLAVALQAVLWLAVEDSTATMYLRVIIQNMVGDS